MSSQGTKPTSQVKRRMCSIRFTVRAWSIIRSELQQFFSAACAFFSSMKVFSELTINQKFIIKERLPIFDFRAREIGHLDVKIWPASSKDKIIGSDLTVHVEIKAAKGLPASVDSTFVKYSLLGNSIVKNMRNIL